MQDRSIFMAGMRVPNNELEESKILHNISTQKSFRKDLGLGMQVHDIGRVKNIGAKNNTSKMNDSRANKKGAFNGSEVSKIYHSTDTNISKEILKEF